MEHTGSNPKEDLQAIREIMERSSKFLSLSGISGIFAGIVALIGAAIAYLILPDSVSIKPDSYLPIHDGSAANIIRHYLILDGLLVLIVAVIGAFYFSLRKARKANQHFWTHSTKRMIYHLLIPFISGGMLAIILVLRNYVGLVAPVMLIFYGLSLVNAGKFTVSEVHYLGLSEIVLGLVAAIFVNHGLLFWAVGFGGMHIIYGILMYYKYER